MPVVVIVFDDFLFRLPPCCNGEYVGVEVVVEVDEKSLLIYPVPIKPTITAPMISIAMNIHIVDDNFAISIYILQRKKIHFVFDFIQNVFSKYNYVEIIAF